VNPINQKKVFQPFHFLQSNEKTGNVAVMVHGIGEIYLEYASDDPLNRKRWEVMVSGSFK